jgi:hypothetical protein
MDDRARRRVTLQIRLLLVVHRAERQRAQRPGGDPDVERRVRTRCLEILDDLDLRLSGDAASDPGVFAELAAARDEIAPRG